jgi:tRNA pseudouridine38-40 synthase
MATMRPWPASNSSDPPFPNGPCGPKRTERRRSCVGVLSSSVRLSRLACLPVERLSAFDETDRFVAGDTRLPEGHVRLRLLIAYLGTHFHGLAPQRGLRTVGDTLLDAVCLVNQLDHRPTLVMSGRTDAGVHAWGQVLHVDFPRPKRFEIRRVHRSLNKILNPEIVVRAAELAPATFDARFSATYRHYRYTIVNRLLPDPFLTDTTWHVHAPLDIDQLRLASDPFIGHHDFTSFCRPERSKPDGSLVRLVTDAFWVELPDDMLRFEIRANAFCQQMVRSIVGFLVEVGHGKRAAGDVMATIHARDRSYAPNIAPAQGLCLWEVGYRPDMER